MNKNSGWDHELRALSADEREPYWPERPEVGPKCDYCSAGLCYIGSYTRWQGTRSRTTREYKREPKRRIVRLCETHGREWAEVHGVSVPAPRSAPPIPSPSCPYCGASAGTDAVFGMLIEHGPGIHQLTLNCSDCGRAYSVRMVFGLQFEEEMLAGQPEEPSDGSVPR